MPGWAAQSFRIAWFGSGLENVGADQVFLKAFGLEAENIHRNRVPSQANPFWSKASGSIVEGRQAADVQIQPGRLDIVLMPISEDVAPTLPLDALDKYLGGMSASLGDLGPAVRLANHLRGCCASRKRHRGERDCSEARPNYRTLG
jgi:hypothetical protein